jgi:hypothetical protein
MASTLLLYSDAKKQLGEEKDMWTNVSGMIEGPGVIPAEQIFSVTELPSGLCKITFRGNLPLGWAGSLAHGLSDKKINILSGYAKRITVSTWEGELVIDPVHSAANIPDVDFSRLLNKGMDRATALQLPITTFIVKECFRENGSLYVEINGHDQVGFLAAVLKRFASCGLYPWHFSILTRKNNVYDKFHLMGPAGVKASKGTMSSLEHKLREWTM